MPLPVHVSGPMLGVRPAHSRAFPSIRWAPHKVSGARVRRGFTPFFRTVARTNVLIIGDHQERQVLTRRQILGSGLCAIAYGLASRSTAARTFASVSHYATGASTNPIEDLSTPLSSTLVDGLPFAPWFTGDDFENASIPFHATYQGPTPEPTEEVDTRRTSPSPRAASSTRSCARASDQRGRPGSTPIRRPSSMRRSPACSNRPRAGITGASHGRSGWPAKRTSRCMTGPVRWSPSD